MSSLVNHPSITLQSAPLHERIPTASLRLYFSATLPEDDARRLPADDYAVRVVVHALSGPGVPSRRPVGRTEPIPLREALAAQPHGGATWHVAVPVEYRFEVSQRFDVSIVACDQQQALFESRRASSCTIYRPASKDDEAVAAAAAAATPAEMQRPEEILASANFVLAHVVGSRGSRLAMDVKGACRIVVHAEEVTRQQRDTASFAFACRGLVQKGCFASLSAPVPLLVVSRVLPNGTLKELWRSPPAARGRDPSWAPTGPIALPDLAVGAHFTTRCVLLQVFHQGLCGLTCIGEARLSHADLTRSGDRGGADEFFLQPPGSTFPLSDAERGVAVVIPPTGARMSPRTATQLAIPMGECGLGAIRVTSATAAHVPTFNELLEAGMEVNLAVAIDFTASNGDPEDRNSLHRCVQPGAVSADNQYARAIHSVCDILMEYDTDKMVPAFGFGAQLPLRASALGSPRAVPVTSHCFHLNGQPDPHVHDVRGILDAYALAVSSVRFSGPTYFADIIRRATAAAVASPGAYTVLLILTDGCINDTDATIDAIVDAGDAPLSIIIVGVGNADFSLMELLDGDDVRLTNRFGVSSKRDLVQFVPFHAFAAGPRWELAAEVLQEVPSQVEDWAKTHGITPDHFDAQSWAAADDEDYETRLRDVRSPSPPATIGGDRDVASHRVVSPE